MIPQPPPIAILNSQSATSDPSIQALASTKPNPSFSLSTQFSTTNPQSSKQKIQHLFSNFYIHTDARPYISAQKRQTRGRTNSPSRKTTPKIPIETPCLDINTLHDVEINSLDLRCIFFEGEYSSTRGREKKRGQKKRDINTPSTPSPPLSSLESTSKKQDHSTHPQKIIASPRLASPRIA